VPVAARAIRRVAPMLGMRPRLVPFADGGALPGALTMEAAR
jgi:hypothetical protein